MMVVIRGTVSFCQRLRCCASFVNCRFSSYISSSCEWLLFIFLQSLLSAALITFSLFSHCIDARRWVNIAVAHLHCDVSGFPYSHTFIARARLVSATQTSFDAQALNLLGTQASPSNLSSSSSMLSLLGSPSSNEELISMKVEDGDCSPTAHGILTQSRRYMKRGALALIPSPIQRNLAPHLSKPRLHRTSYLDGLRGLASFIVFAHHYTCEYVYPYVAYYGVSAENVPSSPLQLSFIRVVYAGQSSLSLALSYRRRGFNWQARINYDGLLTTRKVFSESFLRVPYCNMCRKTCRGNNNAVKTCISHQLWALWTKHADSEMSQFPLLPSGALLDSFYLRFSQY